MKYACRGCGSEMQTGWKNCPHCGLQNDAPVPTALSDAERREVFLREQAAQQAREKIAFDKQYGGCFGRVALWMEVIYRLGCGLWWLFLAGCILWILVMAMTHPSPPTP